MNERAKEKALATFDQEWCELDTLFRSMSESELERPVFTGE